jgi:hypothetical protein
MFEQAAAAGGSDGERAAAGNALDAFELEAAVRERGAANMDAAFGPIDPGAAEHAPLGARRGKIDAKLVEKIQAFGRDLPSSPSMT